MVVKTAAPSGELAGAPMPSRVVARKRGETSCEWCSLEATRYVRFGGRGTEVSLDVVDLCDDCGRKLARAIRCALRRGR